MPGPDADQEKGRMDDGGETRAEKKRRRPVWPVAVFVLALALMAPGAALGQPPAPDEEAAAETPEERETPGFFRRQLLRIPTRLRFTFHHGDPARADGSSDGPFRAPDSAPFGLADLVVRPEGAAYALDLGLFASGGERSDTGGRLGLRFEF